jgi:hypothetical protein
MDKSIICYIHHNFTLQNYIIIAIISKFYPIIIKITMVIYFVSISQSLKNSNDFNKVRVYIIHKIRTSII